MKKLVVIAIPIMFIAGAGGGYLFFSKSTPNPETNTEKVEVSEEGHGENSGEEKISAESVYVPLDPPMIVNIFDANGGSKYLQVSMDVLVSDTETAEAVKKHMPAIRNNLMMLMSTKTQSELNTLEGKDKLRESAFEEIKNTLTEAGNNDGINSVYYSGFVMQ